MKLIIALGLAVAFVDVAVAQGISAQTTHDREYATVSSALEAMRAKSGVKVSVQSGWTVIEDEETMSLWSFTPSNHSAHPAAVHRKVIREGENILIQSKVLCEGLKPACDAMVSEFSKLDQSVRDSMKSKTSR